MSDPIRIADHIWSRGESLIDQLERLARESIEKPSEEASTQGANVYQTAVDGIANAAEAANVKLSARAGDKTLISVHSSGSAIQSPRLVVPDEHLADKDALSNIHVSEQLPPYNGSLSQVHFDLTVSFAVPPEPSIANATEELSQAVLAIACRTFAHNELCRLGAIVDQQGDQSQWIAQLYSGSTLQESMAAIVTAMAETSAVDRVSIFKKVASGFRLVATSTQSNVDRRAQQVRLLEEMVTECLADRDAFSFSAIDSGNQDAESPAAIAKYVSASGAHAIHIRAIRPNATDRIAAILHENFRHDEFRVPTEQNDLIDQAIGSAINRNDISLSQIGWQSISNWTDGFSPVRRILSLVAVTFVVLGVLFFVPASLEIPVNGKLVAAKTQKLFAPTDAITEEVLVRNGQAVQAGEVLMLLRSVKLDLLSEQVKGDLAIAKTELSVTQASRSSAGRSSDAADTTSAASTQQVLQTRIRGLTEQLKLIEQQRDALTIRSPIDGQIDRWEVDQSLRNRPVAHGEYLMDVVAPDQGWIVRLDIPESDSGYVIAAQRDQAPSCRMQLTSATESEFAGTVSQLSQTTVINEAGQSVLRGTIDLGNPADQQHFRVGATVSTTIDCGKHSLGFVWFRSLIQWWRQQSWW